MAPSLETQREWLAQWKSAGPALAEQRRKELRELSEPQALEASQALLSLAAPTALAPSRRTHSGLVEQQALFHRHADR